jgi:hypothetical protein
MSSRHEASRRKALTNLLSTGVSVDKNRKSFLCVSFVEPGRHPVNAWVPWQMPGKRLRVGN